MRTELTRETAVFVAVTAAAVTADTGVGLFYYIY